MHKFSILILVLLMSVSLSCQRDQVNEESLVIAFGSCNRQAADEQPIWDQISSHEPDLWIWLGDIIYADTEDMEHMKADYHLQKENGDYKRFSTSTEIVGIWDDHDYGANNAGKEYKKKDESKELLFSFLDVPATDASRQRPGAYQSYDYSFGDEVVKVILLDVRYFRDEPGEDNTIIGEAQWTWLENEFAYHRRWITVFASGSPI